MEDKKFVAVKEETFNEIKIYGFGVIDSSNSGEIVVKLDDGRKVAVQQVISLEYWVEYVDERDARVIVVI